MAAAVLSYYVAVDMTEYRGDEVLPWALNFSPACSGLGAAGCHKFITLVDAFLIIIWG